MKRLVRYLSTSRRLLVLLALVVSTAAVVLVLSLQPSETDTQVFVPLEASQGISGAQHGDEVIVRGDWGYPPFEYLNEAGEPDGFNIDILTRIAEIMNMDVHISLGPWNEVRNELEQGTIDALAGMYKTEERDQYVDFSIPHFIASYGVFVPRGSDIDSIADIQDKRILVQSKDLGHDYLLENDVGSEIVTVPEWESVLPALADGKADCAVMGLVQGMRLRQEEGYRNVRVLPQPLLQRSYCIAVEEGNRELLAILNEGLNLLKTSGEYDAIYEKWFSVYESASSLNHPLVRALAGGVLVLAIVLISIALWTRSLRRQVRRRTTDLRVTMEQLAQANETKDRFLAGVSHELRTPLHGITGMVQLMDKTNLDTRQSTLVDNMRTASDQLHRVISDLIDISRLDSGKLSLKETSFSLGEVITWIEPVLSKEAQSKGLDLRISTDGDANTPIVTDKERIAQIILNLADNAIKNTDAGGVTIRLTLEHHASEENDVLIIRVHDTGRGISEDDQQSVFTAFTQLETAPGKLAPGLGLGLSIVKSITDLLNGSIEVSSTRGGGSTFTVRLPVLRRQTDHQTGGPSVTERNEAVPSSKQVLIAEDEAINRLYLEQLLSGHGWNTTTASDGEDVMKKFTEGAYDVVFMDLSMPKLGGLEATRRIRDIEARIGGAPTPIIALTAHAREDDRQECLSAGMNGFVTKPFNESSLFREIKRVLEPRP